MARAYAGAVEAGGGGVDEAVKVGRSDAFVVGADYGRVVGAKLGVAGEGCGDVHCLIDPAGAEEGIQTALASSPARITQVVRKGAA